MAKFNFKDYKKTNGDVHINTKLEEQHEKAKNNITDKQLKDQQVGEKNHILEKTLDEVRKDSDALLTEGLLNESKSKIMKHRNSEAYSGDMNKLEEQRLLKDPVEKEKYKAASETPKKQRWWEADTSKDKGQDGKALKLAKTAAAEDDEEDVVEELVGQDVDYSKDIGELPSQRIKRKKTVEEDVGDEDFDIKEEDEEPTKEIQVIRASNPDTGLLPTVYVLMKYDPAAFKGNAEEIKQETLDFLFEKWPALYGLINQDDLTIIRTKESGWKKEKGQIALRAAGEDLRGSIPETSAEEKTDDTIEPGSYINEVDFVTQDSGGTPTAMGKIEVDTDVAETKEDDELIRDLVDLVSDLHPEVKVDKNSFDMSNLSSGEVSYVGASGIGDFGISESTTLGEGAEIATPEENFPITEALAEVPAGSSTETAEDFPITEAPQTPEEEAKEEAELDAIEKELDEMALAPENTSYEELKNKYPHYFKESPEELAKYWQEHKQKAKDILSRPIEKPVSIEDTSEVNPSFPVTEEYKEELNKKFTKTLNNKINVQG